MQAGHPLYSSVYSSQPPAFLLLTEPVWALLGGSISAARTLMLAWSLVGIASGTVIGWRLAGPVAGLTIAALLAIDPLMVQQSVVLQADGPATSLGLLAVALAVGAVGARADRGRALAAFLAGAVLGVGLLTKLLDAAVVPVVALLLATAPRPRWVWPLALGGFAVSFAFLLPYIPVWPALWNQVIGLHLPTSSTASQGISVGYLTSWGRHELPEVGLAALGVLLAWRTHRRLVWAGVLWVVCGVLVVAATHPVAQHYMIAMSPGLALLGGAAASRAAIWYRQIVTGRWALAAPAALLALVAAVLLARSVEEVQGLPLDPVQVASISQLIPPGSQLLSDAEFNQASAGRQAPPALVDTSMERLHDSGLTPAWLEGEVAGDPRAVRRALRDRPPLHRDRLRKLGGRRIPRPHRARRRRGHVPAVGLRLTPRLIPPGRRPRRSGARPGCRTGGAARAAVPRSRPAGRRRSSGLPPRPRRSPRAA